MNDGTHARISLLQPWHRQAKDPWSWYGWTIWAGERQRWLVYATFGPAAAELDDPVDPAGDERANIAPGAEKGFQSALAAARPPLAQEQPERARLRTASPATPTAE